MIECSECSERRVRIGILETHVIGQRAEITKLRDQNESYKDLIEMQRLACDMYKSNALQFARERDEAKAQLRGERERALEEAAYVAERYRDHNGHNQAHWAAKQIRALISKEAGK